MAVTLARFSQEVDVATGSLDVSYFAIFHSDDGRELKLPITQEASQAIIAFFADKKKQAGSVMDEVRSSTENEFMEEEDRQFGIQLAGSTEKAATEDDLAAARVFGDEEDEEEFGYEDEGAVPSV